MTPPPLKQPCDATDERPEMATGRRTWAYPLAALGSGGLIASLWLPWYSFRIPGAILDQAERIGQQFGILAPLIRQGADAVRNLGAIHLTAWQVFQQVDIVLALAGAAAGAMALLAYTERASGVARLIAASGAIALGLAAYRIASPPGALDLLHPAWGAYVALAGAATMLVGGLLAHGDEIRQAMRPPDLPALDHVAPWPTASSVAPPGQPLGTDGR
jgi:hypothetical protein